MKITQQEMPLLCYRGCFPMQYSAHSVVQDNRKGALKYDFILIYQKVSDISDKKQYDALESLPGWIKEFPKY